MAKVLKFLSPARHISDQHVMLSVMNIHSNIWPDLVSSVQTEIVFKRLAMCATFSCCKGQVSRLHNALFLKLFIHYPLFILREIYPVQKPIQPQTILDVITRSISVTCSQDSQSTYGSTVKIQALRTLDALIACMGSNFIPFSPLVFRIVMQILRSSSDQTEDSGEIRVHAYNLLSDWLTTLHIYRFPAGNTWEDKLITHIIEDTTPPKKVVELTMRGQSLKNLSKHAKRKVQNRMLMESTLVSHMPGEKNKVIVEDKETSNEVALAALKCAEAILSACGVFLKPTTHKIIQEHIVCECYKTEIYNDKYILSLLHVLEASRMLTPSTVPPPTQYCLQLYSTLINHQDREISKFCLHAIANIRLHLHCSPPSINTVLNNRAEKEKPIEKRKGFLKRNIAALEKLLGPDRMPPLTNDEEVITIPDEPLNKRPCLEEQISEISLSSESVTSVHSESEVEFLNNDSPEIAEAGDGFHEMVDTNSVEEFPSNILEGRGNGNETKTVISEPVLTYEISEIKEIEPKQKSSTVQIQSPESISNVQQVEIPQSIEVAYDSQKTGSQETIVIYEKGDENPSSTNDISMGDDDVEIICSQNDNFSQENELDNQKADNEICTGAHVDGTVNEVEEMNNRNDAEMPILVETSDKVSKTNGLSVEDMLADFVDEVIEPTVGEVIKPTVDVVIKPTVDEVIEPTVDEVIEPTLDP